MTAAGLFSSLCAVQKPRLAGTTGVLLGSLQFRGLGAHN